MLLFIGSFRLSCWHLLWKVDLHVMFSDALLESSTISTTYFITLLSIFVQMERRHCIYSTFFRNLLEISFRITSSQRIHRVLTCISSTSTVANNAEGYFTLCSWKNGFIVRQGPHHDAVKSTTSYTISSASVFLSKKDRSRTVRPVYLCFCSRFSHSCLDLMWITRDYRGYLSQDTVKCLTSLIQHTFGNSVWSCIPSTCFLIQSQPHCKTRKRNGKRAYAGTQTGPIQNWN